MLSKLRRGAKGRVRIEVVGSINNLRGGDTRKVCSSHPHPDTPMLRSSFFVTVWLLQDVSIIPGRPDGGGRRSQGTRSGLTGSAASPTPAFHAVQGAAPQSARPSLSLPVLISQCTTVR
jgi:hypothetical protein